MDKVVLFWEGNILNNHSLSWLVPEIDICPIFSTVGVNCPYVGQGVHVPAQDALVSTAKEET